MPGGLHAYRYKGWLGRSGCVRRERRVCGSIARPEGRIRTHTLASRLDRSIPADRACSTSIVCSFSSVFDRADWRGSRINLESDSRARSNNPRFPQPVPPTLFQAHDTIVCPGSTAIYFHHCPALKSSRPAAVVPGPRWPPVTSPFADPAAGPPTTRTWPPRKVGYR